MGLHLSFAYLDKSFLVLSPCKKKKEKNCLSEDSRKDSEEMPVEKASLPQQQTVNAEGEKAFLFSTKLQVKPFPVPLPAGNGSRVILVD